MHEFALGSLLIRKFPATTMVSTETLKSEATMNVPIVHCWLLSLDALQKGPRRFNVEDSCTLEEKGCLQSEFHC